MPMMSCFQKIITKGKNTQGDINIYTGQCFQNIHLTISVYNNAKNIKRAVWKIENLLWIVAKLVNVYFNCL